MDRAEAFDKNEKRLADLQEWILNELGEAVQRASKGNFKSLASTLSGLQDLVNEAIEDKDKCPCRCGDCMKEGVN